MKDERLRRITIYANILGFRAWLLCFNYELALVYSSNSDTFVCIGDGDNIKFVEVKMNEVIRFIIDAIFIGSAIMFPLMIIIGIYCSFRNACPKITLNNGDIVFLNAEHTKHCMDCSKCWIDKNALGVTCEDVDCLGGPLSSGYSVYKLRKIKRRNKMSEKVKTKLTTPNGRIINFNASSDCCQFLGIKPERFDDWRAKHKGRDTYAFKVNYVAKFGEE